MHKILLWLGYPTVNKFRRYLLYSFWRNSRTWQTHRQTDRRTDTASEHRPRLCIASRGKNECTSIVQRKLTKVDCSDNWGNIYVPRPGRAGPVFSLDRRRPRLFRNIASCIIQQSSCYTCYTCLSTTAKRSTEPGLQYSGPMYTAIYSLRITIYGSPYSRYFVKTITTSTV